MATIESLEQNIESLRTAIHHLTEAVEALAERREQTERTSIDAGVFSGKKPLDFSSIEGHIQHSPPTRR